nr:O-antigen ligase family protein [Actinomycetota bacterium]
TYELTSRNSLAIAAWWCIALAVGLSLWPLAPIARPALLCGALIAAFALLAALSMIWADSAEKAFNEFNRIALYGGVFAVAVLGTSRGNADRWSDGIALGITGVAFLALGGRFFPDVFPEGDLIEAFPVEGERLSYPLNYWNGLAAMLAMGIPLLLRTAVAPGSLWRDLALAPLPDVVAAIYLKYSRAGTAAAVLGIVAFVVLTARRWAAAGAVAVAGAASFAILGVLFASDELVNGPLGSDAAQSQGRVAGLVLLLAGALAAGAYALALRLLPGRLRVRPRLGWALAAVVTAVSLVGIVAADPVGRFSDFKQTPPAPGQAETQEDRVQQHLLSASGNGRWQWWGAAVDQFEEHPLLGGGAGSYEAWWAQHGEVAGFVRDAHSLYLETLGELGLLGFALLAALFATGIVAGARRLRRGGVEHRILSAAVLSSFLAYALAAGVDWVWELTAVSVVGIVLLGLLTGPATAVALPSPTTVPGSESLRPAAGVAGAMLLVALAPFVIGTQLIPVLSAAKIEESQTAVAARDGDQALSDAVAARTLQPWASSTHLQVALVLEELDELEEANDAVREAIERDESDWRFWLVRARIETKLGEIPAARESLDRAVALNPRSPLFAARGAP